MKDVIAGLLKKHRTLYWKHDLKNFFTSCSCGLIESALTEDECRAQMEAHKSRLIERGLTRLINERVAGALFSFVGYLTASLKPITLGRFHEVCPAIEALEVWAEERGVSIDHPNQEIFLRPKKRAFLKLDYRPEKDDEIEVITPDDKRLLTTPAHCCADGCSERAEFGIYGSSGHPDDATETCMAHVGQLLGTPIWLEHDFVSDDAEPPLAALVCTRCGQHPNVTVRNVIVRTVCENESWTVYPIPTPTDWPDPTPDTLKTPEFEAVWRCIKKWDIERKPGDGYCGATGNHVRAILDALKKVTS